MLFFQRNWYTLFCISGSSSFSVIHVNVDIKIKSKERIGVVVVGFFLSLKFRVAMRFTAETRGYLKCKISPRLTWRGGRKYWRVRTIFSGPKFLGCTDTKFSYPRCSAITAKSEESLWGVDLGPTMCACLWPSHRETNLWSVDKTNTRSVQAEYRRHCLSLRW